MSVPPHNPPHRPRCQHSQSHPRRRVARTSSKAWPSVVSTSAGRITRLNVNVGSQVKAGDVLAELERDSAENAVRQARAALAAAEAKLASVQAGGRSDDVGAAEAGVAQQQAHLQNMRAD